MVVLRAKEDTWLGKHRHRGNVTAVTLKGEWNYKELASPRLPFSPLESFHDSLAHDMYYRYDWIARPGDYVVENPGTIHTLHMGKDAEVIFTVSGSLEYFHDDDSLKNTMDLFSYAHLYYEHCREKGIKPNDGIWF